MVKRSHSFKKRHTSRRKRTTKRSSNAARRQQKAASTWVRKKYTKVFEMRVASGTNVYNQTISLIGGKNSNDIPNTVTLESVDQDNNLTNDMEIYQFFRIRGVAVKMFFPMPTDIASSPVQWACAYSANEIMLPAISPGRVQTLATYQTGSCNQNKPISRFYNTAATYRRFGIQYCETRQFLAGDFGNSVPLYGVQLQSNQGSSVNIKTYRQTSALTGNVIGRYQVTYYVTYKGNKGTSSLINP